MQSLPISQAEIDARIGGHIDELLELWRVEQGATKPRDLELMALALPFPRDRVIRALDLCCGPGDVGRAIRRVYANAHIDCIDRDPFLAAVCKAANLREGIPGRLVVTDLEADGWLGELAGDYDVVAIVNALHWFGERRAQQLLEDVHGSLQVGGVFLLAEPACPERPFAAGFEEWKARQPPRYTRENWERFWSMANGLLGYDHTALLGTPNAERIGDRLPVAGWTRLLERAGFVQTDVLSRDADQVVIGALKSISNGQSSLARDSRDHGVEHGSSTFCCRGGSARKRGVSIEPACHRGCRVAEASHGRLLRHVLPASRRGQVSDAPY
jgi:SAM-dependent methyltransferase